MVKNISIITPLQLSANNIPAHNTDTEQHLYFLISIWKKKSVIKIKNYNIWSHCYLNSRKITDKTGAAKNYEYDDQSTFPKINLISQKETRLVVFSLQIVNVIFLFYIFFKVHWNHSSIWKESKSSEIISILMYAYIHSGVINQYLFPDKLHFTNIFWIITGANEREILSKSILYHTITIFYSGLEAGGLKKLWQEQFFFW